MEERETEKEKEWDIKREKERMKDIIERIRDRQNETCCIKRKKQRKRVRESKGL